MLRLAGFSSGRGDCARGGLVCGAKQVCCGVFRSDHDRRAFLLECLAFDSRLPCVPVGMFFLRLRLVFAACASNRTACDMLRSYSAVGRDRHSCVLESPVRLSVFPPVHFRPERFFMAIPTEYEGAESAAQERFCVNISALRCFPRGVRWGCAPQTAPKSLRLSGLSSGAGRVRKCVSRGGAVLVRIRAAVIRIHGKTRRTPIYGSAGRAV